MPKNKDEKSDNEIESDSEFRQFIKNVKRIKTDKFLLKKQKPAIKKRVQDVDTLEHSFKFSDYETIEPVTAEEPILFARSGVSQRTTRKLRQGKIEIESELDLHGCTVEQARDKLVAFIQYSLGHNFRYIRIIHGKGSHSDKPILKNKINIWLRQLDVVLAFCSTRSFQGGTGAILVLLKKKKHED
jgi:DNA-nicking Smr family endonuclease